MDRWWTPLPLLGLSLPVLATVGCDLVRGADADVGFYESPRVVAEHEFFGDDSGMTEWDDDLSGRLDATEYARWVDATGWFRRSDLDGDGALDERELVVLSFRAWDADGDGRLRRGEWDEGARVWLGAAEPGEWLRWDTDRDGAVDADEFAAGLRERRAPGAELSAGRGRLDVRAFAEGTFGVFDADGDGALERSEWRAVARNRVR